MFSAIVPHKLSRFEWLAFSFGSVAFSGILFAALLKRLLVPVNITGVAGSCMIMLIGVALLFRIPFKLPGLAGFGMIFFSIISFVLSIIYFYRDGAAYDRDFVLHKIALALLGPVFYFAGSMYARLGSRRVLGLNLIHGMLFASCLAVWQMVHGQPSPLDAQTVGSYYQYAGDALALSFILCSVVFFGSFSLTSQLVFFISNLFILLTLGSRASVAIFMASFLALLYVKGGGRKLLYFSAIGIVLLFLLFWSGLNIRILDKFRSFVADGYIDTSLRERLDYSRSALAAIIESPISGDFGYDYPGARYAHNMLDVWANYGLIVFIFYLTPVFCGFIALFRVISTARLALLSVLLTYILVALIFFRHPENMVVFFAMGCLGVFAGASSNEAGVLMDDRKCRSGEGL
ncbi:MAG: O-antigen ligase family protein [Rhodoferax sp.]|nr:O-antigen ligase family protein [Rhodoferax sp.]